MTDTMEKEWWDKYAFEREDGQDIYFPDRVADIVAESRRRTIESTIDESIALLEREYDFYKKLDSNVSLGISVAIEALEGMKKV